MFFRNSSFFLDFSERVHALASHCRFVVTPFVDGLPRISLQRLLRGREQVEKS
jgi:hypothetical protein